jgi:hypothetical protein
VQKFVFFVISSEAQPSPYLSFRAKRSYPPICHFERSAAIPPFVISSEAQPSPHLSFRAKRSHPLICHFERSAAESRNLAVVRYESYQPALRSCQSGFSCVISRKTYRHCGKNPFSNQEVFDKRNPDSSAARCCASLRSE